MKALAMDTEGAIKYMFHSNVPTTGKVIVARMCVCPSSKYANAR
jgi:hypothetical protein